MAIDSTITAVRYAGNASAVTPYPVPFDYIDAADVFVETVSPGTGSMTLAGLSMVFAIAQPTLAVGDRIRVNWGGNDVILRVASIVDDFAFTITGLTIIPDPTLFLEGEWWPMDAATALAQDVDYTLAGANVTTTLAVDAADLVVIFRRTPMVQLSALPLSGALPSSTLESMVDRLTMIVQELVTMIDGTGVGIGAGAYLAGNVTFADTAARALAVPSGIGQYGVQLSDSSEWLSTGTTAGQWTNITRVKRAGDTMTGSLMFTDASCDIGGVDMTRPRDLRLSRNLLIGSTNTVTTTTHNIVSGTGNSLTGAGNYNLVLGTDNVLTLSGGYGHSIIAGTQNLMNTASTEYGWRGQNLIIGNLHEVVGECSATVGFHNRIDGRGTLVPVWATMTGGAMVAGAGGQCMLTVGAGAHAYWHGCIVIASHHNVDGQQALGDVSSSSATAGTVAAGGTITAQMKLSNQYDARLMLKPNTIYQFEFQINAAFITIGEWAATWTYRVVVHQGAAGTTPLLKEVTRLGRGRGSQNGEVPKGWSVAFATTANELTASITLANPLGSAASWTAIASFRQTETAALYSAGGGPLQNSIMLQREDVSSPESVILRDDFVSKNVTTNIVGELGWTLTTMTSVAAGSVVNHPGIQTLTQGAGSTGVLALQSANTPIGAWDLTAQEWVFRVPASVANLRVAVGLMRDIATYVSGGCRILVYDQALSANWRLLHYDGNTLAATYTDTGVPFVANDWVHLKMAFSGTSTAVTIRTTTYPTPVTVSSTAAATTAANAHCPALMIYNPSGGAVTVDLDLFGMTGPTSRI